MPELYKILDPKDVPAFHRGRQKSPLRRAMEVLPIGAVFAAPHKQTNSIHNTARASGIRVKTWSHDGLVYVQRLPDDAS